MASTRYTVKQKEKIPYGDPFGTPRYLITGKSSRHFF